MITAIEPARMPRSRLIGAYLAVLAIGIAGRHFLNANADVSWLLTIAEKWLDGSRLYVDIVELNPPMSIYIYAPGVLLGRLFAIPAETAIDGLTFALAFLCVIWAARLLPPQAVDHGPARPYLAPVVFGIAVILPAVGFSQREHIALILFLPWLALAMRRAYGSRIAIGQALLAGLCGGLVMAIKPHFALAFGAASLAAAISSGAPRAIFALENIAAGCVVLAYAAFAALNYPSYLSDVRPVIELYLSVRTPVWGMLFGMLPLLALGLAVIAGWLAWMRGKSLFAPWIVVTAAAIIGFLAAAILQGKGWPYHFLPALILIVVLLAALGASGPADRRPDNAVLLVAFAVFAQFWNLEASGVDTAALQKPLAAVKPHPRVIAVSSEPSVSFPTTRGAGGIWAGQSFIGLVPYYAAGIAASDNFDQKRLPALRVIVEKQRRGLAADLRNRRADALLIERAPFDYLVWSRRDPELEGLLECFHFSSSTTIGDPEKNAAEGLRVEIWAANEPLPNPDCARNAMSMP